MNVEAPFIPDGLLELFDRPQWVGWREELRAGKRTKVPYQAERPHLRASTIDPSTWADGRVAWEGCCQVGFVFTADDPYTGVDLDGCRDPLTGAVNPRAYDVVRALRSYTELSPSGTGLHVIVRAKVTGAGNRRGKLEMYDRARFFTVTCLPFEDDALPDEVMPRQRELDELRARYFPPPTVRVAAAAPAPVCGDDEELLERALSARNGAQVARLWSGDWSGYPSQSEADAALCRHLGYWCGGDPARVDALFRRSGLYREKWDRPDYRERTLAFAVGGRG